MVKFLAGCAAFVVFFMFAHWTQHFENAEVITASACVPGLPGEAVNGGGCKYSQVTMDGRLIFRDYEMSASGVTATFAGADVRGMAWDGSQSVFTWRTYLLAGAFFLFLAALAWADLAAFRRKRSVG